MLPYFIDDAGIDPVDGRRWLAESCLRDSWQIQRCVLVRMLAVFIKTAAHEPSVPNIFLYRSRFLYPEGITRVVTGSHTRADIEMDLREAVQDHGKQVWTEQRS